MQFVLVVGSNKDWTLQQEMDDCVPFATMNFSFVTSPDCLFTKELTL